MPPPEISIGATPLALCRELLSACPCALLLDGAGGFADAWTIGPLVALAPRLSAATGLAEIDRLHAARRAAGGSAATGLAVLLAFEALGPNGRSRRRSAGPSVLVLEVDAAVQFGTAGEPRLHVTPAADDPARLRRYLERAAAETPWPAVPPARGARTSLPREAYLRAVGEIRQSIVRGDVYQANLCQMFEVACEEPPLDVYARLAATTPAPRSAFLAVPGFALASVSPETFLVLGSPDRIETVPIKGTRPRGATPDADARAAQELQASDKDRAELLMVVDLERNDLSRVCRPGTVDVTDLATVRSYPAVHHLVARVSGRLRPGVGFSDVIHAAFPGGSISGAPKECALEILEQLEPVPRGPFTGALCWLGDDGRIESSVLIRSVTLEGGVARLGAGGGIVFDSDPQAEWEESNHKARALAGALGFAPELAR